ncbi:MAG TPA: hypothetical protein VH165_37215 [Kofleriaceae bacterium]|nr:hypothetical protein [Kofleriaceae bacterium]
MRPTMRPIWRATLALGTVLGVLIVLIVLGAPRTAHAEPAPAPAGEAVALLPLDAEHSLEIYGQPIASEIARALVGGAIQVVVVGPRMAVPDGAKLIVDGTISAGKAGAIAIVIRIRNPLDGKVLKTHQANAAGLAKLDSATAELAAQILPLVRDQLVVVRAQAAAAGDHGHVVQTSRLPAIEHTALIAVADESHAANNAALVAALEPAVADWTRAHHHQQQQIDPSKLVPQLASKSVTGASDLAIGFWVLSYQPEAGAVAMARAKVRVRIADATAVVFDRVVVTDTVLGDRGSSPAELAARVSREILAILRPHMMRHVRAWE